MAFSYQEEVSNGVQTVYAIDFDFRNTSSIHVYKGSHDEYTEQLSWRFSNFNTQIELTNLSEVPDGTKFYIRRVVNRADLTYLFENKSMRGKLVDEANYQLLYVAQELIDGFGDIGGVISLVADMDAAGFRIQNVHAIAETDALSFAQAANLAQVVKGGRLLTASINEVPNKAGLPDGVEWHEQSTQREFVLQQGEWVEQAQTQVGLGANFVTETADVPPLGGTKGSKWEVINTGQKFTYLPDADGGLVWVETSSTVAVDIDVTRLPQAESELDATMRGIPVNTIYKTGSGEIRYKIN